MCHYTTSVKFHYISLIITLINMHLSNWGHLSFTGNDQQSCILRNTYAACHKEQSCLKIPSKYDMTQSWQRHCNLQKKSDKNTYLFWINITVCYSSKTFITFFNDAKKQHVPPLMEQPLGRMRQTQSDGEKKNVLSSIPLFL